MNDIVNAITEYGIEKKNLSDVSDETCENDEIKYIDFDELTRKVQIEKSEASVPSCDSVIFTESINFIEFKSLAKVEEHSNTNKFLSTIAKKLDKKFNSSIKTIKHIGQNEDIKNIKCYVVVNNNSRLGLLLRTSLLGHHHKNFRRPSVIECKDIKDI